MRLIVTLSKDVDDVEQGQNLLNQLADLLDGVPDLTIVGSCNERITVPEPPAPPPP